jgi:asparagine synthase (glutamine-hydrolysing)
MCGINVVYSFTEISDRDRTLVDRMSDEMRYRGPDGQGTWSDHKVCLGAVRLAIIGLGNGFQPIENENGSIILVCNGEIYNYLELKNSLIEQGHQFKTDTDIEVIIHLYEEYGYEFVNKIKGMFAFALYDSSLQSLIFGRDRLGEKPLYYSQQFGNFIVSSEAKTIAIYGFQEPTIDDDVLLETGFSSFPQDPQRTLFNEIKRVLPGEYIVLSKNSLKRIKYWNGRRQVTASASEDESTVETLRLLRQAVNRTMIAEVPVAVMLSGGIDSSAIAALAKECSPKLQAITIGYEGHSLNDERAVSRRFARELGITIHEIQIGKEDFVAAFDEYPKSLDESIWDPASVMQWYIFRRASELGFKVLLSGQGSDELFFGYPSHINAARQFSLLKKLSHYMPVGLRGAKFAFKDIFTSPRVFYRLAKSYSNGEWTDSFSDKNCTLRSFYNPRSTFWSYQHGDEDSLDARFNYLREIYLSANGFLQADKLAMAHSVEVRCPFADTDLVNFALSLPVNHLIDRSSSKWLLKRALKNVLPSYIINAEKKGFQPSDECLLFMVKKFTSDPYDWSAMTKEITRRIINNIADARKLHLSR